MRKSSLDFLKRLVDTPSPSGQEIRGQRVWLDEVSPWADATHSDAYGNCVATLNGAGSPHLMLAAHADEIALAVNYITDEGYVHVRRLGGVDPAITKAQRVLVHTRRGPVKGVVGNVAPHLSKQDKERRLPEVQDLFIDLGVASRREAERLVRVGDPITLEAEFELLRNDLAIGRALDNRVGTWAVAEALRLIRNSGKQLRAKVSVVSNIMEETGLQGARQIAYALKPDVALVVDVTHATDVPTVSKPLHGDVRVGSGPTVTHGGCNHREVVARLEAVARRRGIRLQHEAVSATSGTDTDVIFWTRGGIPSALVSLPTRYMHSPVELVSLRDLEKIPELLAAFAFSLQSQESFKVRI